MKRLLVALAIFFAFFIPVPAQADTCVDDLINLGTGLCLYGGPQLPRILPLDPPLISRPTPAPTTPAPQATQSPRASQPTQQPAQPAPKKTTAPRPQPKSGSVTQAPKTSGPATPRPSATPSRATVTPSAAAPTKTATPKIEEKRIIVVQKEPNTITVGYTLATVLGIVAIAVCASFLIFYRRRS